ncbi:MAG: response regulator [Candidatus Desulfofervidaceae bacterium]|nr:response regulator [Candidatus Desulfofervidaceae bacterium]
MVKNINLDKNLGKEFLFSLPQVLSEIGSLFLEQQDTHKIITLALDKIKSLTHATHSIFIYKLNNHLITDFDSEVSQKCRVKLDKETHFWERILKENDDVFLDNLQLPPGHIPINNFYGKKIRYRGEILGFIGVSGVDKRVLNMVKTVLNPFGSIFTLAVVKMQEEMAKKKIELQFAQFQRMEAVGALVSGIAHNFNNMLMAALGRINLLKIQILPTNQTYRHLEKIEAILQRSSDFVRELLTIAQGGERGEKEIININDVINRVLLLIQSSFPSTIEIQTYLVQNPWPIKGDASQLEQALLNICLNARDAMPEGGRLIIETKNHVLDESSAQPQLGITPEQYVLISITDTGVGMDEETQKHIFDPFFTTKGEDSTTGLGLTVAYAVIRQHNGFVNVSSTHGKGTCFNIYLPVAKTQAAEFKVKAQPPAKGNILLVEDEAEVREIARDLLQVLGYQVIEARDGEEGIALYRARRKEIDAIILDLVMPRLEGKAVFKELKAIDPQVKVIISSGYSSKGTIDELVADGVKAVLFKPYTLAELRETLETVLKEKTHGIGAE